jgi:DNA-binding GntR family transcriptional regulator
VPVSALLPGELQLMEDYPASRHTIQALRRLEELG